MTIIISLSPCDVCAKYEVNQDYVCQCKNNLSKEDFEQDLLKLLSCPDEYIDNNFVEEFKRKWGPKGKD